MSMIVKDAKPLKETKSSVKRRAPIEANTHGRSMQLHQFSPIAKNISKMASLLERATISKDRLKTQEAKLKKANADLAQEISERIRTEELFRRVVDWAPNGMLIIDRKGTILLANLRMENMFGYDQQDLLGRSIETLIPERYRG
jgi:PAS domain-containing protein